MHIRCPHCRNAIEVVEESSFRDMECPSCGSHFNLVGDADATFSHRGPLKTIAHFELIEQLGIGAFGAVFKARDTKLDRIVAIKIPRRVQLSDQESESFFRDARAAAQVSHPNVVSVFEVGKDGDTLYIASDFVDGADLQQWMKGEPLPPREAAELMIKIAEGVHTAHEKGVIHRDLKPANIMIGRDRQPRVMDFGLAKRESGEITMTMDGATLGTPAYMSPEQAMGKAHEADARSDVYSLGVILYEMLTGHRPFQGEKRMLIVQILEDDPPPIRRQHAAVARDLETICFKCLQKEPTGRYSSAKELGDDLRRWLSNEPIHARPVGAVTKSWKWCKRHPATVAVFTTLIVAALTVSLVLTFIARAHKRARLMAAVDALEATKAEGVPIAIRQLQQYPEDWVREEIVARTEDESREVNLSLAYGLAAYDITRLEPLRDAIEALDTSPAEVPNLVAALSTGQAESIRLLTEIAGDAEQRQDWSTKTRAATIAMYLGDTSIAAEMLRGEPQETGPDVTFDPIQRTRFISEFPKWSGKVALLASVVKDVDVPHCKSGLALALGGIETPTDEDKGAWAGIFSDWYTQATDSGTHSAASWVMRQWGIPSPEVESSIEPPTDRDWWHQGELTLVHIRKGSVLGENGPIVVEQDFWLSDREVSVGMFQQFMDDAEYCGLKPLNWQGARVFHNDSSPDLPVQQVSWFDAVMFCNWLSWKLDLEPSYEIEPTDSNDLDEKYTVSLMQTGGIRLPTEAEWEYACRAGTTTNFSFGDEQSFFGDYGWFTENTRECTHLRGEKRCNAWGLFDMHGNVWEWCWDRFALGTLDRVRRGGSWSSRTQYCQASFRNSNNPSIANYSSLGFRVALHVSGR